MLPYPCQNGIPIAAACRGIRDGGSYPVSVTRWSVSSGRGRGCRPDDYKNRVVCSDSRVDREGHTRIGDVT